MKNRTRLTLVLLSGCLLLAGTLHAQPKPFKVKKDHNVYVYHSVDYGETVDTHYTVVASAYASIGKSATPTAGFLVTEPSIPLTDLQSARRPGYTKEELFAATATDSLYGLTTLYDGEQQTRYLTASAFSRKDLAFDTARVNGLVRYTCSINSNKLEFYVQPAAADITPVPYYGRFGGILVAFFRNGQCQLELCRTDCQPMPTVSLDAQRTTPRELARIKRSHTVLTTRIFDSVQLCWGIGNSHIEGDPALAVPFDSVLHFAGGTLALKRLRLPHLPAHCQTFVEIHQRSNGDAYDRTGSLFVLPGGPTPGFFRGMNEHPDSLPLFTDHKGGRYQGIRTEASQGYYPPVELVRFFTSFGVGHFNDRVTLDGLEWEQENYYKQEVTELASCLQGEVWVGIWIGNYDKGGHIVTVDLKSYPNDDTWDTAAPAPTLLPLFNTCNVLEMAGQNYGRLFETDSLTVTFTLPAEARHARLRYIATGHGGWDGGDEFNPKANTLLLDGKPAFVCTPWRCDCGRYREWNPVSGNFWNGTSSSDYSRSGWCPGTATQPLFFDLPPLAPGTHTLTVAIPQGASQAGSFSHWCVSGCLILDKE